MNTGWHSFSQTDVLSRKNFDGLAPGETTNGLTRYLELQLGEITNDIKNRSKDKPLSADDYHLAQ